jgi:hypothetical protein
MPRHHSQLRCHCRPHCGSKQWTADNAKAPLSAPPLLLLLHKQAREGRPTMPKHHCFPCSNLMFNSLLSRHVSFIFPSESESCLNQDRRLLRSPNDNVGLYCCPCPSNDGGLFHSIIIFLHSLMYDIHNSDNNMSIISIVSVALSNVPIVICGSVLLAGPMMPLLLLPLF